MERIAVEEHSSARRQHAMHALEPSRFRQLDSFRISAILSSDLGMVQAAQLVAALNDLETAILLCALVYSHEARREVRIQRARVVPVPL